MDVLHHLLENIRRLGLKLEQDPATAFTAAARNEARARDPVAHPLELSNRINPDEVVGPGGCGASSSNRYFARRRRRFSEPG
jgi:hypothetical protein